MQILFSLAHLHVFQMSVNIVSDNLLIYDTFPYISTIFQLNPKHHFWIATIHCLFIKNNFALCVKHFNSSDWKMASPWHYLNVVGVGVLHTRNVWVLECFKRLKGLNTYELGLECIMFPCRLQNTVTKVHRYRQCQTKIKQQWEVQFWNSWSFQFCQITGLKRNFSP